MATNTEIIDKSGYNLWKIVNGKLNLSKSTEDESPIFCFGRKWNVLFNYSVKGI